MTFHRAAKSVVRAVKRRLSYSTPPGRLVEDSIKQIDLPGTHQRVTLFIFEIGERRVFIAETYSPDNNVRIYKGIRLPPPATPAQGGAETDAKEISRIMLTAITAVAQTVQSDPRFRRNIITLDSGQLARELTRINANGVKKNL